MNEQYEKSLSKLELDKVLPLLADHASSQAAKDRCMAIRPSADADEIRHLLEETSAACNMHHDQGLAGRSAGCMTSARRSTARTAGGCLSPEELLRIAGGARVPRGRRRAMPRARAHRKRRSLICIFSSSRAINTSKSASSTPSSPRTRSRTRPAASLPPSAARSGSRARRSASRCRRSSPRRPTRRSCRSRS